MAKKQRLSLDQFNEFAEGTIHTLRSFFDFDPLKFSFEAFVIFGESSGVDECRHFLDKIIVSTGRTPSTCRPWKRNTSMQFTEATAIECCSRVLRSIHLEVFRDLPDSWATQPNFVYPVLWHVDIDDIPTRFERMRKFLIEYSAHIAPRFQSVLDNLDGSEITRICAEAHGERVSLCWMEGDQPNAIKKRGNWSDDPSTKPDEYAYGPIQGQLKQVAEWTENDGRTLGKKVCTGGSVWGSRTGKRNQETYSVWFRHKTDFDAAEKRRATALKRTRKAPETH